MLFPVIYEYNLPYPIHLGIVDLIILMLILIPYCLMFNTLACYDLLIIIFIIHLPQMYDKHNQVNH